MKFLRAKWNRLIVLVSLLGFPPCGWSTRAAETVNRVVVTAEDVDLAKMQSGGQIVFVSSGQRAAVSHAIDDDRRTVFLFAKSDPRPTVIVRLNKSEPLHRVSVVVGSEAGQVDVYLLDQISADRPNLDKEKPVGSIADPTVAREAMIDFAPQNARYVALRWALPNNYSHPLAVAEISILSNAPDATAHALADPPQPDSVEAPPRIAVFSP